MSTSLDAEGMQTLVTEHGERERARDWDGVLATMVPNFLYEFFPYRLRVTGVDAIKVAWAGLVSLPCFTGDEPFIYRDVYFSADTLVIVSKRVFLTPHGDRRVADYVTRYEFQDRLILSESVYMDAAITAFADGVFDDEFRSLPGVDVI